MNAMNNDTSNASANDDFNTKTRNAAITRNKCVIHFQCPPDMTGPTPLAWRAPFIKMRQAEIAAILFLLLDKFDKTLQFIERYLLLLHK
jgi:hypothetical protein